MILMSEIKKFIKSTISEKKNREITGGAETAKPKTSKTRPLTGIYD